ncbi:ketopantoate reductase family protein [Alkalicoccobacillus porphyridii]|nr:ketopantoate reductase family protein [Alkalicoccobacillus porphyridii]
MRILVLGAGVIGSYLTHSLLKAGQDVTILARGKRVKQLQMDGLVIKHFLQRKVTTDKINVISTLTEDDFYDLIFVVMKYNQFPSIYLDIAQNRSENIVFIGNNANPTGMEKEIQKLSTITKNIGFGFNASGGIREDSGRVVSTHGKGNIIFGEFNNNIPLQKRVKEAFGDHFKVTIEKDVEAWLLTHYIFIIPFVSLLYLHDFDAKNLSKSKVDLTMMIEATYEGFSILKDNGFNVTPSAQEKLLNHKRLYYVAMKLFLILPINQMVSGGMDEIVALYDQFEKQKNESNLKTNNWDQIKKHTMKKYRNDIV